MIKPVLLGDIWYITNRENLESKNALMMHHDDIQTWVYVYLSMLWIGRIVNENYKLWLLAVM